MLMWKGPCDWHSGHEPGFTSWVCDWKNGPSTKLHLLQLYLTMPSWGSTPVQLLTTPLVRISWFKWSCLHQRDTRRQAEGERDREDNGLGQEQKDRSSNQILSVYQLRNLLSSDPCNILTDKSKCIENSNFYIFRTVNYFFAPLKSCGLYGGTTFPWTFSPDRVQRKKS